MGSALVLRSPMARTRDPVLQARLAILQKNLDQQQYDAMVSDINHSVRPAPAPLHAPIETTDEHVVH